MGGEGDPEHKAVKKLLNEAVDQAVYLWFMQKRSIGQPISGPLLCEKALDFSIKLGGSSNFRASTGWLQKFKKRHWIREIEIHGEKLSASESSASKFRDEMKSYLEQQGYKDEFIYNADETGLYGKSLPRRSLASRAEDAAPGHKVSKERVTIMICANASGTHRIPLLLIGKSKKPRSFKNTRNLPVVYSSQRKAWMNSEIFIDCRLSFLRFKHRMLISSPAFTLHAKASIYLASAALLYVLSTVYGDSHPFDISWSVFELS
ncbi:centromere binding protein B, DNA binding protein [Trichuris suis]|nr:centromere binding protein B, DNA binding protein [Trichuris suis]